MSTESNFGFERQIRLCRSDLAQRLNAVFRRLADNCLLREAAQAMVQQFFATSGLPAGGSHFLQQRLIDREPRFRYRPCASFRHTKRRPQSREKCRPSTHHRDLHALESVLHRPLTVAALYKGCSGSPLRTSADAATGTAHRTPAERRRPFVEILASPARNRSTLLRSCVVFPVVPFNVVRFEVFADRAAQGWHEILLADPLEDSIVFQTILDWPLQFSET